MDTLLSGLTAATDNIHLVEPTKAVVEKFRKAFLLFGKCHKGYNGNVTDDASIKQIGKLFFKEYTPVQYITLSELDIEKFMAHYRSTFPTATVLPKMHLMEDHMIHWLKKYNLGAGLMGEQGAESIHAHLHRLERTYSGIPNGLQRLKYIFNMYQLETAPTLQTLRPVVKKRKRKVTPSP